MMIICVTYYFSRKEFPNRIRQWILSNAFNASPVLHSCFKFRIRYKIRIKLNNSLITSNKGLAFNRCAKYFMIIS